MALLMHGFEPGCVHVRIDLRRADVGVAEQFLHDAQVRATRQQMRREAVSKRVRRQTPIYPQSASVFLHQSPAVCPIKGLARP